MPCRCVLATTASSRISRAPVADSRACFARQRRRACGMSGITRDEAHALAVESDLDALLARAAALRDTVHGRTISYSRKVFIPLTQLCRDSCHYCTFAHPPRRGQRAYLSPDEVLAIARAGRDTGCHEALFTLGDKPELRYRAARDELATLGFATTLAYLEAVAA